MGEACICSANLLGDFRISYAESLDVHLVNNGVGEGNFRSAIVTPVKTGVGHHALRNTIRVVLNVHLEVISRSNVIREYRCLPVDFSRDCLRIRVDEQFVVVEAMPLFRSPRTFNSKTIELTWLDVPYEAVPDKCGTLAERNAISLRPRRVEQAQIYAGGILREDREIGSFF